MVFWIRSFIFGCILVILAYLFFDNKELLMSFGDDPKPMATEATQKVDNSVSNPSEKKPTKKENSAAKGLSKFYANINGSPNVNKPTIRNNIIYLPALKGDLELMLDDRMKVVVPYPKDWQGTTESRPFRLSDTIYGKLSEYAKKDKLKVFWRLNRDYIVKDTFRINKNILNTALQLGNGISGHFPNGVSMYFCYQSRSIVAIEGTKSYLDERCTLLKSNSGY